MKNNSIPRAIAIFSVLAFSGLMSACGDDATPSVICSPAPVEEINSFSVEVRTGDDATDADIQFCITLKSDPERICTQLDAGGDDDFSKGAIGTYEVDTGVAAGDLASFRIENRGGSPGVSFDGDDWQLDGLRVIARTTNGGVELVEATTLSEDLDAGGIYDPGCAF
jgi:hypothetical protein